MTVKISGVLKDGTGKPVQNCTIVLKARRTSSTVVVNTVASENPDEAGRYSMDVEHGQYSVTLLVEGFPPSHAGTITVYEGSRPGTLNDFLGAMMTEDDVRPEALRRFEQMVEEVSRNASAVAQNTAAAKNQPAMPVHQPARRQLMQPMLQPHHVPPARQPDRPRRRLSQRLPAQERHRQRPVKQQKVLLLQSHQKARQLPAPVPRKRQKRMPQHHKNRQPLLHPQRPRRRQKLPPRHGVRRPQKRQRNLQKRMHHQVPVVQLPRQRRQEIPRRRKKTSETNAKSSETAAGQSASAAAGSKTAAALSASAASTSAGQASASATAAGKSAESAASSASTATTKAGKATEQATAAARSASAAKTSETNAKTSADNAASSKAAAASSASSAASSASSASASKDEATRQASAAKGSATTATTKASEAAGSATAAAQSKSTAESAATRAEIAAKRAEDIASAVALEDASTTKKGIVQLSSATNSTSESLAATPKAVKAVMGETNKKAPLNSPALTGTPTTPTARQGTNNTQIASTAYVMAAIAALVDSSPDALNTLNELAAALGNDPNFATTMTSALAGKQPKDATLTALAGLATAADRFPYFTGNDVASLATLTKVGRDILAKSTVAAVIEYLGLRELGTSGEKIPLLSTANTWTNRQTFSGGLSGELSGNASTAAKLKTARKISNVAFDGSSDITLKASHVGAFALGKTGSTVANDKAVGWNWSSGAYNATISGASTLIIHFYMGEGSCPAAQFRINYKNGGIFYRSARDGYGFEADWSEFYTTTRKPSAGDVGALPLSGGQLNGALGIGTSSALGGNSIVLGDNDTGFKQNGDGNLDVYANNVHVMRFVSGSIQSNKTINITGRVNPSDYGNFDSRYVKDVRLGSQQYYGVNNWQTWNFQCPSGHVLSGINVQDTGSNSADNIAGVYYRPVQKYINGTWYNVASV